MQIIKNIAADKYFWLGVLIGFIAGTLHHNFGL